MDKKKLFKFLDVALLLIFLVPVIIPQYIDTYKSLGFGCYGLCHDRIF